MLEIMKMVDNTHTYIHLAYCVGKHKVPEKIRTEFLEIFLIFPH